MRVLILPMWPGLRFTKKNLLDIQQLRPTVKNVTNLGKIFLFEILIRMKHFMKSVLYPV